VGGVHQRPAARDRSRKLQAISHPQESQFSERVRGNTKVKPLWKNDCRVLSVHEPANRGNVELPG
jgi:hypothetical protein